MEYVSRLEQGDNTPLVSYFVADHESKQIGTSFFSEAEELLLRFGKDVVLLSENGLTQPGSNKVYAREGKFITTELFNAMLHEWKIYRVTGNKAIITNSNQLNPFMQYCSSGPSAFSYVDRAEAEVFMSRHGVKPTYVSSKGVLYTRVHGGDSVLYGAIVLKDGFPLERYLKISIDRTLRLDRDIFSSLLGQMRVDTRYVDIRVSKGFEVTAEAIDSNNELIKAVTLKPRGIGKLYTHFDAIEELAKQFK